MDARHKELNKYLLDVGVTDALTKGIARLFLLNDRPDHAVWFLQSCIDEDEDEDFIIEYDNLLNELDENRAIMKKVEKPVDKAAEDAKKAFHFYHKFLLSN